MTCVCYVKVKARQGEDEFCNTTCDINIIYFIMF